MLVPPLTVLLCGCAGQEPPIGKQAVGWRIAVYWKTDQTFYPGLVQAFDATTGRHHVLYADGDEEHLCLSSESLKWLLPPPFRVSLPPRPPNSTKACRL